jgi:hypothetical protein
MVLLTCFFQEKSRYYITEENIDEAIENALNNIVSYNYAIDLNGTKFDGENKSKEADNESPKLTVESIN